MGFTFSQHLAAGSKIFFVEQVLSGLRHELEGSRKNNRLSKKSHQTTQMGNKIKCRLDDFVCRDFPERPDAEVFSAYYGIKDDHYDL